MYDNGYAFSVAACVSNSATFGNYLGGPIGGMYSCKEEMLSCRQSTLDFS